MLAINKGNAPGIGSSIFSNNPTIYYLGGTTGWGATFANCPTALWLSPVQCYIGSTGVQSNIFGFNIVGTAHELVVVEACTNLTDSAWVPVVSNTIPTNVVLYFSDPGYTNDPVRFYQLDMP